MDGNSTQVCSTNEIAFLKKHVRWMVLRLNALLVANAILMAVIAGIGAYGHHYRHHPLIRFLYLGAITLFLPIVSDVVSTLQNPYTITVSPKYDRVISSICQADSQVFLVILWIGLVQIVGANAAAIVAADSRERQSIAPSTMQLVKAIWTSYLAYIMIESGLEPYGYNVKWSQDEQLSLLDILLLALPYGLILAKLLLKYYAWYKASRSLAFRRNPRLIVGYMEKLQVGIHYAELAITEHDVPPPLIVMREDTVLVEKQPHGYSLAGMNINNGLLTIDKVWQLDDTLLQRSKDMCLAFALFKMLRCRFARYTISEAGFAKASNFMRHVLLEDSDDERVLGLITNELWFLHDYYCSYLPVTYSESWLPFLSVSISLSSIGYCLFVIIFLVNTFWGQGAQALDYEQIYCHPVHCHPASGSTYTYTNASEAEVSIGRLLFDVLPVCVLGALGVLVEAREIANYICSNWTKVALICSYAKHISWQQSPMIRKCVGHVLRTRCKLLDQWEDKLYQCSILVLHPSRNPIALLRRVLDLPDEKKVPRAVKAAVLDVVRMNQRNKLRSNCATPRQLQVGSDLLWTFNEAKGAADAMLVCHVATSILEMTRSQEQLPSDHEIVATHLSRYCAYLVACCPKLLPDDHVWCRSLYKAVKKDAGHVQAGRGITVSKPEVEYRRLVKQLSARSKHQVLKDGAELGQRLAELPEGEEVAWKDLVAFWSEMIVSIAAACDNIDEHAEAVARGGELVTLLWALLAHVGSVDDDTATHGAPDVV